MTNATYVSCSKHAPNSAFFVLYWDFLYIANNNYTQAAGLRVMETKTNDRIIYLLESGKTREEISEEDLWLTLHWSDFAARTLHLYEKRSFQTALPALIKAGFVRQRYVKVDAAGQVIRDEAGRTIAYASMKAARADKAHCGEIVNQFLFCSQKVNAAIDAIGGGENNPPPSGSDEPGSHHGEASADSSKHEHEATGQKDRDHHHRDTAQGVNSVPASEDGPPVLNIHQGSQNCEGSASSHTRISHSKQAVSQNCQGGADSEESAGNFAPPPRNFAKGGSQNCAGEAGKIASNNNYQQESGKNREESSISAPRAIDPLLLSQFDFSQAPSPEAIMQLACILYPPLKAISAREENATQTLATRPLVHELGLRRMAALMAYHADETSPCQYRAHCRAGGPGRRPNPGVQMRLYQLESEPVLYKMSQEMEASGWWPDYLPRATGLVETPPDIDLAELAGIDSYERVGMDHETASSVAGWLHDMFRRHGYPYEVQPRRISRGIDRGFAIEIWFTHDDGTQRALRLYRAEQWDLVVDAYEAAPWGSIAFVRYLAEALRRGRVA